MAKIFPMTTTTPSHRQPVTRVTPLNEYNSRAQGAGLSPARAEFLRMVAMARPDDSDTEHAFIKRYIDSIEGVERDTMGNRFLSIPNADGSPPVICWTSHTDTVAFREGWQSILYDRQTGIVSLAGSSKASCLGADCTAGVWLMRQMALERIPGMYAWYRAEESGAIGSTWSADKQPERYADLKCAIALDRRGFQDVITHQGGRRTASDAFAASLAHELNGIGLGKNGGNLGSFRPDSGGIFTDTRELIDVVPECTNLSVGYLHQHSSREVQYTEHLENLLPRLIHVARNPERLVIMRKAGSYESEYWSDSDYYYTGNQYKTPGRYSHTSYWGDYTTEANDETSTADGAYRLTPYEEDGRKASDEDRMSALVRQHPDVASALLIQFGLTPGDMADEVFRHTGIVHANYGR